MDKKPTKIYFYLAIALCAAGAVLFGLAFSPAGLYALIASILCAIAALSFTSAQKKKNAVAGLLYVKIAAYVVLALSAALFIGGLVYSLV
ncbi:MAG: hypothetical protein K2K80_01040 [Clostridia bacterium]|nr:hypothetical protein [Clostridia bacterium]